MRPDGTALFLAGTLPGELVQPGRVSKRGNGLAADSTIIEASADRCAAPCPHFGPCGGCALQHMADGAYAAWKRGVLDDVVRRLGFAGEMPPLVRTPPGARRRMDLAFRRDGAAIRIGLHARRSTEIVDMQSCPVLHPTLFALVQALRPVLRSLDGLKQAGSALVNLLDSGADLLLRTDAVLSSRDRTRLTALAEAHGLPRIAWGLGARGETEPACQLRPAITVFSGHTTTVPSGAFLQASTGSETAIQQAVLAALPRLTRKARIVELFAGVGTLTHALTTVGSVQAYEGDMAAVQALRGAGNPRVAAVVRDLARQPLQGPELKGAGAVVLDPPYGGALAQMPALAASGLPIVYVTCNPAALLRDGRLLMSAGYRVTSAVAIDQFLWSARVEGVVGFSKS